VVWMDCCMVVGDGWKIGWVVGWVDG
jgi:hypothetical protein